ncbi:unnamed protein product [Ambrosiozyma monospora]|uniref:Unnamed protein product n=1 Tax=Ambrosiozyma monospora TaxID=43982 RepID=A0ACB5U8G3_AMBMO|nr:unnamed protein product [Ambrosiozyma monospora]
MLSDLSRLTSPTGSNWNKLLNNVSPSILNFLALNSFLNLNSFSLAVINFAFLPLLKFEDIDSTGILAGLLAKFWNLSLIDNLELKAGLCLVKLVICLMNEVLITLKLTLDESGKGTMIDNKPECGLYEWIVPSTVESRLVVILTLYEMIICLLQKTQMIDDVSIKMNCDEFNENCKWNLEMEMIV